MLRPLRMDAFHFAAACLRSALRMVIPRFATACLRSALRMVIPRFAAACLRSALRMGALARCSMPPLRSQDGRYSLRCSMHRWMLLTLLQLLLHLRSAAQMFGFRSATAAATVSAPLCQWMASTLLQRNWLKYRFDRHWLRSACRFSGFS